MSKPLIRKIIIMCLFIVLYVPAQSKAQEQSSRSILNIQTLHSKTGLNAWLIEDHSVPVIALNFAFKNCGSTQDPPEKQGLSQLLSNTLDEGAGDLDSKSFQKSLRDIAAKLSFQSDRDYFYGTLKTLSAHKKEASHLLTLSLTRPRFDLEAIERMRAANQARIRSSLSDPDWIAARLQYAQSFAGHPYARNSGGTLSGLESLTQEDLKQFAQNCLAQDNLVIGISGDITAQTAAQWIDQIFSALPRQSKSIKDIQTATHENQGMTFLFEKDIPQTVIRISQPGMDSADPDYPAALVLNQILGAGGFGSRLMKVVREERGLTYGIYSGLADFKLADSLTINTSTQNNNVQDVLDLITREFQKISDSPVNTEELNAAKSYLLGSLPLSFTSTDAIAGTLVRLQLTDKPLDYLDQRQQNIAEVHAEDIQNVAQRLLRPDQFTTILVGQPVLKNKTDINVISDIPDVE